MEEREREQLRRLAGWLAARRDVDDAVAALTRYGPVATERVNTHLVALRELLTAESDAFARVEDAAPPVPQRPLPRLDPPRATVHLLSEARARRDYA